ncbi:unnamed protein product [Paramecium octaurelia]|uniref:Transmembrane protein n=1 Tax=Paramecium octaurelia TaxID=43137 RepID=A0A8S1XXH5_PAROT|nr:unnamed protein product [Paramecium octaurelia]
MLKYMMSQITMNMQGLNSNNFKETFLLKFDSSKNQCNSLFSYYEHTIMSDSNIKINQIMCNYQFSKYLKQSKYNFQIAFTLQIQFFTVTFLIYIYSPSKNYRNQFECKSTIFSLFLLMTLKGKN